MSWLTRLLHRYQPTSERLTSDFANTHDIAINRDQSSHAMDPETPPPPQPAQPAPGERLVAAASKGDLAVLEAVLVSGEPLDAAALGEALRSVRNPWGSKTDETVPIARRLLNAGADVDWRDEYWRVTPLLNAVKTQNFPWAQLLVEQGANPALADRNNHSPLNQTSHHLDRPLDDWSPEYFESVKAMAKLVRQALPNRIDENDLLEAFRNGAAGILRKAINEGFDIDAICRREWKIPAMHCAARWGQPELVAILLECGHDPNARTEPPDNETVLGAAICDAAADHEWASGRYLEVVRLLVEAGADLNGRNSLGHRPLQLARGVRATRIAELIEMAGGTE